MRADQLATRDLTGGQRSPSSLCVCSDKRQRGRAITSAIAVSR